MIITKSRNLNCACGIAGIDKKLTNQIESDLRICPFCGWATFTKEEYEYHFDTEFNGLVPVEE